MFAILALFPIERTHEEVKRVEQTFGSFLREKRMARGLTLRGMAAKLDLSPVYMSNIENDRRAAPSQEYLERMAMLLQLDIRTVTSTRRMTALFTSTGLTARLP